MLHVPPPPNYTQLVVDAKTTCNVEAHITEYAKAHTTSEGEDTHLCNALNTSSNADTRTHAHTHTHTHTHTTINTEVQTTINAEAHITGYAKSYNTSDASLQCTAMTQLAMQKAWIKSSHLQCISEQMDNATKKAKKRARWCRTKSERNMSHHQMPKTPVSFPTLGPAESEHSAWYTDI